jgi:hypothetical protein
MQFADQLFFSDIQYGSRRQSRLLMAKMFSTRWGINGHALSLSFALLSGFMFVFILPVNVFLSTDKIKQNYLYIRTQGKFCRRDPHTISREEYRCKALNVGR